QLGEFNIMCSAYCGVAHSGMLAIVKVVSERDFNNWLAAPSSKNATTTSSGLEILQKNGCITCHSLDGTKIVGPTFKGLYGSTVAVITGMKTHNIKADEQYIKTSITDPDKDIVVGFNKGLMQSYKTILTDEEINKITEFLKTLKAK
ncbi:MAG: c-type cytochrome, partial [Bacteroidota bacterium]|nr:c-type cytochrome [Bacteroidota bacterium]